jgi:hypothetical protein
MREIMGISYFGLRISEGELGEWVGEIRLGLGYLILAHSLYKENGRCSSVACHEKKMSGEVVRDA